MLQINPLNWLEAFEIGKGFGVSNKCDVGFLRGAKNFKDYGELVIL